jgi:lipid-binding SYLF domain-containing protein
MSWNKRSLCFVLVFAMTAALRVAAADDTDARLKSAAAVLNKLTDSSGHGIRSEQMARADCVAVIPGFKKGTVVVGVGFGRGFIACRNGANWSAPGAVTLESGSLGAQIGGEKMDIVVLSLDKELRPKLLSDRFTIGSDASAAWGNGKSVHDDSNAKILFFGKTDGVFAGFGLDGASLKADDSSNKTLYGKPVTNSEIVEGHVNTPASAEPLFTKLSEGASH